MKEQYIVLQCSALCSICTFYSSTLEREPSPSRGDAKPSFDGDALLDLNIKDYNRCSGSDSGTQIIIGLSTGGRFMLIQLIHLL